MIKIHILLSYVNLECLQYEICFHQHVCLLAGSKFKKKKKKEMLKNALRALVKRQT